MMFTYILLLMLLLVPFQALSASFDIVAPELVNRGAVFPLEVFLNTEGESVNALEGRVAIPDGLMLDSVRYQGSVVSLWIEEPRAREPGVVTFAGVIPAGYSGNPERGGKGNLFSLLVRAEKTGIVDIETRQSAVYLNDGLGTLREPVPTAISVRVVEGGAPDTELISRDSFPPEPFTPEVIPGEPFGLSGYVLVFKTLDKDSGLAGFEYASSWFRYTPEFLLSFSPVESPVVLIEGEEERYLFVRALDREGNARIEVVSPPSSVSIPWVLVVITVVIILLGFFYRKRFRVFLKK